MPDRLDRREILERLAKSSQNSPVHGLKATEAQVRWIRSLIDTRIMSDPLRAIVIAELDRGMTRERAQQWIPAIKSLPRRPGRFV